jgi:hypothetical protein
MIELTSDDISRAGADALVNTGLPDVRVLVHEPSA